MADIGDVWPGAAGLLAPMFFVRIAPASNDILNDLRDLHQRAAGGQTPNLRPPRTFFLDATPEYILATTNDFRRYPDGTWYLDVAALSTWLEVFATVLVDVPADLTVWWGLIADPSWRFSDGIWVGRANEGLRWASQAFRELRDIAYKEGGWAPHFTHRLPDVILDWLVVDPPIGHPLDFGEWSLRFGRNRL